jgi:hypothetical protein
MLLGCPQPLSSLDFQEEENSHRSLALQVQGPGASSNYRSSEVTCSCHPPSSGLGAALIALRVLTSGSPSTCEKPTGTWDSLGTSIFGSPGV